MKKIFSMLAVAAALALQVSCTEEDVVYDITPAEGKLNLSALKVEEITEDVALNDSDELSTYMVRIADSQTGEAIEQWAYNELPEIIMLKVGNYKIEALSDELQQAAFDAPYYYASKEFTISENEITNIGTLVCRLSNVKVSVSYEDELMALFGDDVSVVVELGKGSLLFSLEEQRAAYFSADSESNILTATLSGTIDGELVNLQKVFTGVKAGEHRAIKYTLQDSEDKFDGMEGDLSVSLKIDATCKLVNKDVNVGIDEDIIDEGEDDKDEVLPPPSDSAPVIVGDGFNIDETQDIPSDGATIVVNISAEKSLSDIMVTIDSETLTADLLQEVGLNDKFSLAYPGQYEEQIVSLGFPVKDQVIGQTSIVFDITPFTSLLGLYGEATHKFIITAVDADGTSTVKTLTLKSVL